MQTLGLFIFRWYFRLRLQYYLLRYGRNGKATSGLLGLSLRARALTTTTLLADYHPTDGARIEMLIGLHTAEDALVYVFDLIDAIRALDYVPDHIARTHLERKALRFNNWLQMRNGSAMSVQTFYPAYMVTIIELYDALEIAKANPTMHRYYLRKTEEFVNDLFVIMEALETLALRR